MFPLESLLQPAGYICCPVAYPVDTGVGWLLNKVHKLKINRVRGQEFFYPSGCGNAACVE